MSCSFQFVTKLNFNKNQDFIVIVAHAVFGFFWDINMTSTLNGQDIPADCDLTTARNHDPNVLIYDSGTAMIDVGLG